MTALKLTCYALVASIFSWGVLIISFSQFGSREEILQWCAYSAILLIINLCYRSYRGQRNSRGQIVDGSNIERLMASAIIIVPLLLAIFGMYSVVWLHVAPSKLMWILFLPAYRLGSIVVELFWFFREKA